jgi:hypothetical protein
LLLLMIEGVSMAPGALPGLMVAAFRPPTVILLGAIVVAVRLVIICSDFFFSFFCQVKVTVAIGDILREWFHHVLWDFYRSNQCL